MGFMIRSVVLGLILHSLIVAGEFFKPFNVSYDGRAMIIDGERRILISGGIHYARATPEVWPDLISKSKEGGVDVIETYLFWNVHEPVRGQYVFEERYDLVKFVKLVGSSGLYLFLRIGPYACAEWNFGGFPVWLRDIPGIEFRTDNTPFKIENEYGNIESSYGPKGHDYMIWAAKMASGLGAGVPWVMCKQVDAPENIIDTCNGYYCDGFRPNSNTKPVIWTENWDGWYTNWGDKVPHRPCEDIAFAVARFFQRGGSFMNYYMYFGGTNFGRTAGGPNIITSYDYDAPIDEYGLLRQPKWGHLKDLHAVIKLCEPALVAVLSPQYIKLGPKQEAHVYSDKGRKCSAFLANIDELSYAAVKFRNFTYILPPWSVSILPDCRNVAFNTAKIGVQTSINSHGSDAASYVNDPLNMKELYKVAYISKNWSVFMEPIGVWGSSSFTYQGILEHLNVTKDESDYLWYTTRIYISHEDIKFWEENQVSPVLTIDSMRDLVYIFVNGEFTGSAKGKWIEVVQPVDLIQGYNEITLLSQTVGLQNYGAFLEKDGAGFRGQIKIKGCKNGDLDITDYNWTYQVGLKGEFLKIYDISASAEWTKLQPDSVPTRFSWYKTYFDVHYGLDPVALDMSSMGKGQVWVNGNHIGRYWTLNAPKDGCETCDYRGAYGPEKYHIPRSWLQASNNLLVVFEETEKNPFDISIKSHFTETICAQMSEDHNPPLHAWSLPKSSNGSIMVNNAIPEMHLNCDSGYKISRVEFASYGTPQGSCRNFSRGNCHAANSFAVVHQACVGRQSCSIIISNNAFGGDPCRGIVKTLSVEMKCSPISATGLGSNEMIISTSISSF
ncbi:beta-galactosidase [Striga asiatica]|uniref:beta-galactosidase n=1 Tax=Striga asiatica TaxID=4170 RepID=A0A5A7PMJ4_STRAF|nr:beta-galactosidase [Striga asiatica]